MLCYKKTYVFHFSIPYIKNKPAANFITALVTFKKAVRLHSIIESTDSNLFKI